MWVGLGLSLTIVTLLIVVSINNSKSQENKSLYENRNSLFKSSMNTNIVANTLSNASIESNATDALNEVNTILSDADEVQSTLDATLDYVDDLEAQGETIDPIIYDGVATMQNQADETTIVTEEAVIESMDIELALAEAESEPEIIETFVGTILESFNINRNNPTQGQTQENGNGNNSQTRGQGKGTQESRDNRAANRQAAKEQKRLEKETRVLERKSVLNARLSQLSARKAEREGDGPGRMRMARSAMLNEKQTETEQRLTNATARREQKMLELEQKLQTKQTRSKAQAKDDINKGRERNRERKERMNQLKGRIKGLQNAILSILMREMDGDGDGDGDGNHPGLNRLMELMVEINPDYTISTTSV